MSGGGGGRIHVTMPYSKFSKKYSKYVLITRITFPEMGLFPRPLSTLGQPAKLSHLRSLGRRPGRRCRDSVPQARDARDVYHVHAFYHQISFIMHWIT